jgi:hypothetical protein
MGKKMKKIALILLVVPFMSFAMEVETKKNNVVTNLKSLPPELQTIIIGYVANKEAATLYKSDGDKHYALCYNNYPYNQPQNYTTTHKIQIAQLNEGYISSLNLNPCVVSYEDSYKSSFFSVQCWNPREVKFRGDAPTMLRVDSDIDEKRFLIRLDNKCAIDCFDGPNNNNFFIATGQNLKNNNYFYLFNKSSDEISKRIFLQDLTYKRDVYRDSESENDDFKYDFGYSMNISPKIITCALSKTSERFALVNKKGISILEMPKNYCHIDNPKLIAQGDFDQVQKIAFITPTMLLILSLDGYVFFAAVENSQVILHKQTFKNKNKEELKFKSFAVDACNPHHVVLQSATDDILLWDLYSCDKSLKHPFVVLQDKPADYLWFYDNKICLATKTDGEEVKLANRGTTKPDLNTEHYFLSTFID